MESDSKKKKKKEERVTTCVDGKETETEKKQYGGAGIACRLTG